MVLKKPYAFLIKHFKVIHFILFAIILYITYRFNNISTFFANYVKNNYSVGVTIAQSYIPITIFLAVLIVIIFSTLMWLLMNNRKKPNKFYLFTGIYYLFLLITIIYAYNTINSLDTASLTQRASRALRDIYQILLFPNFYFLIISFIRGIGFDVKKFNFKEDLEELEIKSEDNEEFEFVLGKDSYKWKRKVRRSIREFKYYVLENKFFISIIVGVIAIIGLLTFALNVTLFKKSYHIGDTLNTDTFSYKLNNAYMTSYDLSGKIIKDDKKYIILDFTIKSLANFRAIKPEEFYLTKRKNVYNFKSSLSNSFRHIGISYKGDNISTNAENYIFVFEVETKDKGNFTLNVFDTINYKNDIAEYEFKTFKFKPTNIDSSYTNESKNVNDLLTFNNNIYGNTSLTIKNIKISNSFEYKYNSCDENNNCNLVNDIVIPADITKNNLLIIEYNLNLDKKAPISKTIANRNFFNGILQATYKYQNKNYMVNLVPTTNGYIQNVFFADIPKNLQNVEDLNVNIKTRNENYAFSVK